LQSRKQTTQNVSTERTSRARRGSWHSEKRMMWKRWLRALMS